MKKLTQEEIIIKFNEKHLNKFDYSEVIYINTKTNISIICKLHGIFLQTPSNHLAGNGCPVCAKNAPLDNSIIDHKVSNRNIKRIGNYANININIEWICSLCNYKWQAAPNDVINKNGGCPYCAIERRRKK